MSRRIAPFVLLGLGLLFMAIGLFDPREDAFELGRAPVLVAALIFSLTGIALLDLGVHTRYAPALRTLTGTLIAGAFTVLSGIVALAEPVLFLFSFVPCLILTVLGVWATARDFRRIWIAGRGNRDPEAS